MDGFKLVMVSAGFEHGGNVTHRHLDGHSSLLVYPLLTQSVQMWDYLFIDDACDALIKLIDSGASGAFNFASGDCRQLKDYVLEMRQVLHSRSELRFGAVPYPPTGMSA